jgi:hypothetical protein
MTNHWNEAKRIMARTRPWEVFFTIIMNTPRILVLAVKRRVIAKRAKEEKRLSIQKNEVRT